MRRFPRLRPDKALVAFKISCSTPRRGNLRLAQHSLARRQARVSGLCGQALISLPAKNRNAVCPAAAWRGVLRAPTARASRAPACRLRARHRKQQGSARRRANSIPRYFAAITAISTSMSALASLASTQARAGRLFASTQASQAWIISSRVNYRQINPAAKLEGLAGPSQFLVRTRPGPRTMRIMLISLCYAPRVNMPTR